jgi:putative MATE family efflux protein
MILANILNMVLDPIFIFGWFGVPRMDVAGAAVATVLSQLLASILVVGGLIRGVRGIRIRPQDWSIRAELIRRLLKVGIPSTGQMLSRSLMQLVLMRVVVMCGTAALAAYGIAMRFHMLMIMPAFAIGNAVATMVGQNLGAGRPDRAERAAWTGVAAAVAIAVVAAAFMLAFARPIMATFAGGYGAEDIIAIGADYLWIVSPFLTFAAVAIVLGRAHQGAGDAVPPLVATVVALWLLQVPLAIYLPRFMKPATHGIWWAVVAALVSHGLMMMVWFRLGHWKHKEV